MKRRRFNEVDRISTLPEPILHHIMSFLSFKKRVQISILSKKWKDLWHTFPDLEWDEYYDGNTRKKKVMQYLERTLLKRHLDMICINKLTLGGDLYSNYEESVLFLDRCLSYAIGSDVKELKLVLSGHGNSWYNLPQIIFSAKSIDVLELWCCKLYSPRMSVRFSLRKICLRGVYADDHAIESLISGCPLIELTIAACQGFKSLELLNLSKLNEIEIEKNDEVERMVIKASNVNSVTIREMSATVIDLALCKNLKQLELYELDVVDNWICNEISELPLLEYLSLYNCKNLRRIQISSPSLKELLILSYFLHEVKINTPNLNIFRYKGAVISFASISLTLTEADLCFKNTSDAQNKAKYIEFLSNFSQVSGMLKLRSSMGENVIIPSKLRQILLPPLSGIKHLNLEMGEQYMFYSLPEFVDGLLWLSPHIEDVSVKFNYGDWHKFCFQFLYKRGETSCCCQSRPVSCWQNCIEKVEIVDTITFEAEPEDVKRYCIEDSDIFEKFKGLYKDLREEWDDDWSISEDLRDISDDNDSYHS